MKTSAEVAAIMVLAIFELLNLEYAPVITAGWIGAAPFLLLRPV